MQTNSEITYALSEVKFTSSKPVPEHFGSYVAISKDNDEYTYGDVTEDRYGKRLVSVTVQELLSRTHLKETTPTIERAAIEYLKALDPKTRVVLFWN